MIMLKELRKKIDKIDKKIAKNLSKRYEIINKIAAVKQKNKLPILNKTREEDHLNIIIGKYKNNKACKRYISKIFQSIFNISRDIQ